MPDFTDYLVDEVLSLLPHRVIALVGHFGSGKTELAINLSINIARRNEQVTLMDLDLIKPYFRCRLLKDDFPELGIRLVAPEGDRFYADIPILLPEARGLLMRVGREQEMATESSTSSEQTSVPERLIMDAGGNDLGAKAVGSLFGAMDLSKAHTLFVVNTCRPFSASAEETLNTIAEVERAGRLKINGLIANNHFMDDTEFQVVEEGINTAREVGRRLNVPLLFASATATFLHDLVCRKPDSHVGQDEHHDQNRQGEERSSENCHTPDEENGCGSGQGDEACLNGAGRGDEGSYEMIRAMFGYPVFPLERRILPPHLNYCDKEGIIGRSSQNTSSQKRPGGARVL